jgi:Bax protein
LGSVSALVDAFQKVDYRLDAVRKGDQPVPRIIVEKLPADLHRLESLSQRKRVFIKLILPLVLYVNEQILTERGRLVELREDIDRFGRIPDPSDRAWLARMGERYGLDTLEIDALLRRIDMIPPSLAVAQAAEESGWGSSRFAREGNAVFGQYTFVSGSGLVPLRRDKDRIHEVRSFSRLLDSVGAYMFNLNYHRAYGKFRRAREHQRKSRGRIDGYALAGTLKRYSERGDAYVKTIRAIIKSGGLRALDRARLGAGAPPARVEPKV